MNKIVFALLLAILAACQGSHKESGKIYIVATTGMLGDAIKNMVPDSVQVDVLMGPGVDPHLYKATQKDFQRFSNADLIVYNGLHLEGKLSQLLSSMNNRTYAAAEVIPESELKAPPQFSGAYDPHIWHDMKLWRTVIDSLALELADRFPSIASHIQNHAPIYGQKVDSLHTYAQRELAKIQPQNRALVTAHDAFGYFGLRYEIEVHPLQGISTVSEFGLADISNMVEFVTTNKIPAVFVESSISPRSIEAIIEGARSRGHNIRLGGTLYSDALGGVNSGADSYVGMITHNIDVIREALK